MQRLERDMPKFLRAQRSYVETFEAAARKIDEEAAKAAGMTTEQFLAGQEEESDFAFTPEGIEDAMRASHDLHQ